MGITVGCSDSDIWKFVYESQVPTQCDSIGTEQLAGTGTQSDKSVWGGEAASSLGMGVHSQDHDSQQQLGGRGQ